ncbi:MAG: cell division protein ZipA [Rhodanobacteraceae bacterium]
MAAETLTPTEMRVILIILGLIVLALIYWFGKPGRREQGQRRQPAADERGNGDKGRAERVEPTLGHDDYLGIDPQDEGASGEPMQSELDVGPVADPGMAREPAAKSEMRVRRTLRGKRPASEQPERIVSLLVMTRQDEQRFHGPDIVVAAEKTGLEFGDLGIFHRLLEGKPELGPVFSAANMVKPGDFDMASIQHLETPGLNLFMTLPGPIPALDAWDTMLPTARRLAELLDGRVVDDQRNALGRQRVAYIRDDLRAWDRKHKTAL